MLICIITQSVDLVFVISWVSRGLDSVTVSQPWLIALAWPWLYQISHKPHPIIINIVKVLQCHQISTFWCVINSSGCIIDKWKHKSMAEKIFHNPAEHGCHFYKKFDSLSYTVKHWTRFRILHGKCWHTVFHTSCWRIRNHTSEGTEQVRFLIQRQVRIYLTKHFPCGVVFTLYILRHSSFWQPFFNLSKMLKFVATHHKMTNKKSIRLLVKIFVNNFNEGKDMR